MSQRASEFHQNPWHGVFYITGGGSALLAEMLTTPGASATVLEASVPYAGAALSELLGAAPEQAVAAVTARQMAAAAYLRASNLVAASAVRQPLFGFGCTATLATTRKKKGQHRAHWAIQTAELTAAFHITFDAQKHTRDEEEHLLVEAIWLSLQQLFTDHPSAEEHNGHLVAARAEFAPLLQAQPHRVCVGSHDGSLLLPGSFNPIHDGHRELLATAEAITGLPGAYELAVKNADKPALDYITLETRLRAIPNTPIWLTNTANFADKAKIFPDTTFALGVDTLARIGDPRFYQDDSRQLQQALQTLVDSGARFLVFGRMHEDKFITLQDLRLPEQLALLCTGVPESSYRNDLSSTQLRQQSSTRSNPTTTKPDSRTKPDRRG